MTENRPLIFIPVFIIAACAAGYLLYTRQTAEAPKVSAAQEPTAQTTTSSGSVKNQPASALLEYTRANKALHAKLTQSNVIWLSNYERVQAGLLPFVESAALNRSATKKNSDMVIHQYFAHTRPGSSVGFDSFVDGENYSFIKVGENLAMGSFSTATELVSAWMNSPEHRHNVLDPAYREIGVSISEVIIKGKSTTLITQHFGDPRSSCPSISSATKNSIESLKKDIVALQKTIGEEQCKVTGAGAAQQEGYDTVVEEYNQLVNRYNGSIQQMAKLVTKYNAQVASFDRCVQGRR